MQPYLLNTNVRLESCLYPVSWNEAAGHDSAYLATHYQTRPPQRKALQQQCVISGHASNIWHHCRQVYFWMIIAIARMTASVHIRGSQRRWMSSNSIIHVHVVIEPMVMMPISTGILCGYQVARYRISLLQDISKLHCCCNLGNMLNCIIFKHPACKHLMIIIGYILDISDLAMQSITRQIGLTNPNISSMTEAGTREGTFVCDDL